MKLQEHNFEIVHRQGGRNQNAEFMSRFPYDQDSKMRDPASQPPEFTAVLDPAEACSGTDDTEQLACMSIGAEPSDDGLDQTDEPNEKLYTEVTFEYTTHPTVAAADEKDPDPKPEMGELQRQCHDFKDIFFYLQDRTLPEDERYAKFIANEANQYVLRDGTLYHLFQPRTRRQTGDDLDRMILQVALPKVKRVEVLRGYHDCLAGGGHFGVTKTFGAIRLKYWWPKMYQIIHDYVQNCDICQRIKVDRHRHPVPLNPLPVEEVFSRLHIDILGPLPKTKEGYQYCLVIVDSFSKWCESFAMRTQEAAEVASILYNEIFTRYGAPRTIVSDRARNFMSKLVAALCEMFRVIRHYT